MPLGVQQARAESYTRLLHRQLRAAQALSIPNRARVMPPRPSTTIFSAARREVTPASVRAMSSSTLWSEVFMSFTYRALDGDSTVSSPTGPALLVAWSQEIRL